MNFTTPRWLSALLAINGVKVEVTGREHLRVPRPAVFVFNHRNPADAHRGQASSSATSPRSPPTSSPPTGSSGLRPVRRRRRRRPGLRRRAGACRADGSKTGSRSSPPPRGAARTPRPWGRSTTAVPRRHRLGTPGRAHRHPQRRARRRPQRHDDDARRRRRRRPASRSRSTGGRSTRSTSTSRASGRCSSTRWPSGPTDVSSCSGPDRVALLDEGGRALLGIGAVEHLRRPLGLLRARRGLVGRRGAPAPWSPAGRAGRSGRCARPWRCRRRAPGRGRTTWLTSPSA